MLLDGDEVIGDPEPEPELLGELLVDTELRVLGLPVLVGVIDDELVPPPDDAEGSLSVPPVTFTTRVSKSAGPNVPVTVAGTPLKLTDTRPSAVGDTAALAPGYP